MIVKTGKTEYCHICKKFTAETFQESTMHIANICPECETRRIGKPYITRKKFIKIMSFLPNRGLSNANESKTIH